MTVESDAPESLAALADTLRSLDGRSYKACKQECGGLTGGWFNRGAAGNI